ncbi:MAG: sugar ABC transporter substrate-binding protein [Lachnospiraceae bacterium]|nr:sugar ABC transporter substrate-binding protein [Lachnospiraceae bacterium]
MKRKNGVILLTAAVLGLFGSGCGSRDAAANSAKIFYAAIESGDYYEGWASQLQEQADLKGASFDVGYAEKSVETQDAQIKSAVAGACDVLLCGLVSPETVTEIKAAAGDTPIVFINNAPEDGALEKDRYVYVASDEFMAGQYQAEYILEQFRQREEINIVILKGPKDASGAIGRTKGLKQTLKASGKKVNYVFEDHADWNNEKAQDLIELFLKTGQPVDCVAANNDDMALGAVAAFEKAGMDTGSVLFLGVDASSGGCQAIAEGRMDFTVYQPTSDQISSAVEAAKRLASGESVADMEGASEDGKYILIPFEKVDGSNVAQYQ